MTHPPADPTTPRDANAFAIYSIFCGLIGIPTAFLFGLGGFFGVMAIVLGRRARRAAPDGSSRPATAGMVLGAIAVVLALAVLI